MYRYAAEIAHAAGVDVQDLLMPTKPPKSKKSKVGVVCSFKRRPLVSHVRLNQ